MGFGSTFYLLMDEEQVKISFSSPSYILYRYRGQIYEVTKPSKVKISIIFKQLSIFMLMKGYYKQKIPRKCFVNGFDCIQNIYYPRENKITSVNCFILREE